MIYLLIGVIIHAVAELPGFDAKNSLDANLLAYDCTRMDRPAYHWCLSLNVSDRKFQGT